MRSARMSLFAPLNSAVSAMRKRSAPKRLATILARSSSRLTHGATWLAASSGWIRAIL